MKYSEMNENQKSGLALLKEVQKRVSTRFNAFSESRVNGAWECIKATPDFTYDYISEKIVQLMKRGMDVGTACNKYVELKGVIEDNPMQPELPRVEEKVEVKTETKQTVQQTQDVVGYMGLLEKTLAEVIVKNQGESIKNEIIGNFEEIAKNYMLENYGVVQKKVEVQVGEIHTEFNEVLHEKFDTVLKFVQMNEPVFLTGNAGTGKNVLCKQVAKALGLDFYFTNAVAQEYKLTGFTDASGIYHKTQFYDAFTKGGLFMLDEMDASIPEVLVILNCAIANRYFDFPSGKDENGNVIGGYTEAHPDFRVISAGNTFGLGADAEYVGRYQLDLASLDRFALVEIGYDKRIETSVAEGDEELVQYVEELRNNSRKYGIRMVISYRSIGRIAKMLKLLPMAEVLQTCLLKNLRKDDIQQLVSGMTDSNKYTRCTKELVA